MFRWENVLAMFLGLAVIQTVQAAEKESRQNQAKWEKAFTPAIEYLKDHNGHALLVYRGDELLYEGYYNNWSADRIHRLASGTKSFNAAIAIVAAQEGLLKFDEKVDKTITEWQDDPLKSQITIRELLSLRSGLDAGRLGRTPSYKKSIEAEAKTAAGKKFEYGPVPFQVFGELMRRKLQEKKQTPLEYLDEKVFKPIGLEYGYWRKDEDGQSNLPSGAFLTARNWAKFGLLIRDGGKWNGKQILDSKLLKECFQPSKANPNYGICFWLGRGKRLPKNLVMAAGAGKQKLYMFPEQNLLIVQFAEASGKRYSEEKFLNLLYPALKQ